MSSSLEASTGLAPRPAGPQSARSKSLLLSLWMSTTSIIWELVRKAESQALPQTHWIRICTLSRSEVICVHIKEEDVLNNHDYSYILMPFLSKYKVLNHNFYHTISLKDFFFHTLWFWFHKFDPQGIFTRVLGNFWLGGNNQHKIKLTAAKDASAKTYYKWKSAWRVISCGPYWMLQELAQEKIQTW